MMNWVRQHLLFVVLLIPAGLVLLGSLLMVSLREPVLSLGDPVLGPVTPRVRTALAEERLLPRLIPAIGTLRAWDEITLSARVGGFLERLEVDIGDVVRRGQVVARIDPVDYELALRQAEASVAQARARLGMTQEADGAGLDIEATSRVRQAGAVLDEASKTRQRLQELHKAGLIASAELDQAEAAYEVALHRYHEVREEAREGLADLLQREAERDLIRHRLEYTSIHAPFEGTVQRRLAGAGEYVPESTPLLSLVRTDRLRLRIEVPERSVPLLHTGQTVRFRIENSPARYEGRLVRLSPMIRESDRVLVVEADVENPGNLRPGMFVRAEVVVEEEAAGIVVPAEAIRSFVGIDRVVAVRNGEASEVRVETGRRFEGWVEIRQGLQSGERVILEPGNIRSGEQVRWDAGQAEGEQ